MNEAVDANIGKKFKEHHQPSLQYTQATENPDNWEDGEKSTWSKHLNWIQKIKLSLGKPYRVFKSFFLSSEDDTNFQCTSDTVSRAKENLKTDLLKLSSNNDVIMSKNNTAMFAKIENTIRTADESPSTSHTHKNNGFSTGLENILLSESDDDTDSIVIAYLKDKGSVTELERSPITKNVSVLENVPKMETIPEEISETSLDVHIPSYPGSPRSLSIGSAHSTLSIESHNPYFIEAVEFLHEDKEFLIAAETGNAKILDILIRKGTDIHQMDHLGRNALHLAVCSDSEDAVRLLLKTKIKTNIKDNLGMTSLSLCLMRRPSYKIANLLFDHGAEIVPRSNPVDTGLFLQFVMMCKSTKENAKILQLLVAKGAVVNDPEAPGGRQALHFAAMSNDCKLIEILADLGADLTLTNHRNETPRDVAQIFKCKDAYELLCDLEDEDDHLSTQSLSNV